MMLLGRLRVVPTRPACESSLWGTPPSTVPIHQDARRGGSQRTTRTKAGDHHSAAIAGAQGGARVDNAQNVKQETSGNVEFGCVVLPLALYKPGPLKMSWNISLGNDDTGHCAPLPLDPVPTVHWSVNSLHAGRPLTSSPL